jgi:hypothetical protein
MPLFWICSKLKAGRDVYNAGGDDRKQFYRQGNNYDEYDIASQRERVEIPQASIEPSNDQGVELENEHEDINAARIRGHTSFNNSHMNASALRRVTKKGEYESYDN